MWVLSIQFILDLWLMVWNEFSDRSRSLETPRWRNPQRSACKRIIEIMLVSQNECFSSYLFSHAHIPEVFVWARYLQIVADDVDTQDWTNSAKLLIMPRVIVCIQNEFIRNQNIDNKTIIHQRRLSIRWMIDSVSLQLLIRNFIVIILFLIRYRNLWKIHTKYIKSSN